MKENWFSTQHMGEFNASTLADFGAALTTVDEPLLQEVLEELDVSISLHLIDWFAFWMLF